MPTKKARESKKEEEGNNDDASSEGSLDIGACCMCHCALDYSDRAAFFSEDREEDFHEDSDEEEYFFRPSDPYLPAELYNPNNALVYCDSCNRMYHQHCHFVPILVVPRGSWHCLACQTKATASMFQSPPVPSARKKEQAWEAAQAGRKALATKNECRKLTQFCQSQLSNLRLATTALETLTSTAKNLAHFSKHSSQELVQTVFKLCSAKYKLRQAVRSMEDWRSGSLPSEGVQRLKQFVSQPADNASNASSVSPEFVSRVLFPFGSDHPVRIVPRTDEAGPAAPDEKAARASASGVPKEVVTPGQSKSNRPKAPNDDDGGNDDGDDDGVSVDNLTCAVCWQATATDANDLVLCDGRGCCRSYHMRCVHPHLTEAELEADDWFCPICTGAADLLHLIQSEYHGDEWELRRHVCQAKHQPCDGSLKSWEGAQDVFPESAWEYEAAVKLKEGKHDGDTKKLLARALGLDEDAEGSSSGKEQDIDEDDDDDDEQFDPKSFEEERHQERAEDSDENSTRSSQATIAEMSSIDLNIGTDELAALSDEDSDKQDSAGREGNFSLSARRSRRLAKRAESTATTSDDVSSNDPGKLDESNILSGKRNRKPVDYWRLNEAIFGSIPDDENASLDDMEDFRPTAGSSKRSSSSDEGSAVSGVSDAEDRSIRKESVRDRGAILQSDASTLQRGGKRRKMSVVDKEMPAGESSTPAKNGQANSETMEPQRRKGKMSGTPHQSATKSKNQGTADMKTVNAKRSKSMKLKASAPVDQESSRQHTVGVTTCTNRKKLRSK